MSGSFPILLTFHVCTRCLLCINSVGKLPYKTFPIVLYFPKRWWWNFEVHYFQELLYFHQPASFHSHNWCAICPEIWTPTKSVSLIDDEFNGEHFEESMTFEEKKSDWCGNTFVPNVHVNILQTYAILISFYSNIKPADLQNRMF